MPITVQQFDFIAEVNGIGAALAAAEQAGGVVGTRSPTPAQVVEGPRLGSPSTTRSLAGTGTQTQYMPGTVTTPSSVDIGAACSPESAGGVGSAEQQALLQSIMSAAAEAEEEAPWSLPSAPPPAPAALSIDDQILAHLAAGNVVPVSDLAQMTDPAKRIEAATQLGKNIVTQGGNTQDTANSLNQLFGEYFDAPGTTFLDWATSVGFQFNPDGSIPGAPAAGDTTTVYFSDGTSTEVNNNELEAFLANNPGAATSPPAYQPGMFGASEGDPMTGAAPLQGTDQAIFDFLAGLYKKQLDAGTSVQDSLTNMLNEAADTAVGRGDMFGQPFTDRNAAYQFFLDWAYSPTQGNFGAVAGWNTFEDAAMAMPAWTAPPTATTTTTPSVPVIPTLPAQPAAATGGFDMGGLGQYGTWETLRPFGQIYPGFTSLLPGYVGSPAVQSAYAQAAAPLEMQYLARQATTPLQAPGTEEIGSDVKAWLQNVQAGTQPLMMGQDYANFLNQLSGVLGAEGARIPGMDVNVQSKMAGLFQDPQAQLAAFMNPFYQATAGAPQVRKALMDQIAQAAQRYQYQEPSGAFLPWAIEQNIGGIQGILPGLANWSPVGR